MTRKAPHWTVHHATTLIAVVLLMLILFVTAAYFFFLPAPQHQGPRERLLAELQQQRDTWNLQRPPAYRYVVDRDCACSPEIATAYDATEFRGDRSAAFAVPVETSDGRVVGTPAKPLWIDDLFVLVEGAIRDGAYPEIRYDRSYGFPASLRIDSGRGRERDELGIEVRDFEVLEYR